MRLVERPLKNRVSSLGFGIGLLAACHLGLGLANADVVADSSRSAATDTTLSEAALRQRGVELDNYIYEASRISTDSVEQKSEQPMTESSIRPQTLWITAGIACLLGVGIAWLISGP